MSRLRLEDGAIDLSSGRVERPGASSALTGLELRLVQYLAQRVGRTVPREDLLTQVWGYHRDSRSRAPANTISRLRAKIERDPSTPRHLITEYGGAARLEVVTPIARAGGFVGRHEELKHLDQGQRVSIVGPGGSGKTRLAREFAERSGQPWVWCELAACHSIEDALATMATILPTADPRAPAVQQILDALERMGPVRVVLDNVEQLDVQAVLAPLDALTEVQWLLTSRRDLGLTGERVVHLGPLDLDASRRMFLQRGGPDHPELDALLVALEGSPLAIELAAARTSTLSVPQIRERLARQLDLLAEGEDSLRASVAWSWSLLDAEEQRALVVGAVFLGGIGIDAAESLMGPGALDALGALVKHNLVRVLEPGRFSPYEPVRRFAEEHVDDALRDQHAAWFGRLGHPDNLARIHGPDADAALSELLNERFNLQRAARRGSSGATLALADSCAFAGPAELGVQALHAALERETDPTLRRRLLLALGNLAQDPAPLETALGEARSTEERARCGYALALILLEEKPERAKALLVDAMTFFESTQDLHRAGGARNGLGRLALFTDRHEEAEVHFRAALRAAVQTGDRVREAMVTNNLGLLHAIRGETRRSRRRFDQALELHRASGNLHSEVLVLGNLARLRQEEGDLEACIEEWLGAIDASRQLGNVRLLTQHLASAAIACAKAGRLEHAERLVEEAERLDGPTRSKALVCYARAQVELGHGDLRAGRRYLNEAHRAFTTSGDLSSARLVKALLDEVQAP